MTDQLSRSFGTIHQCPSCEKSSLVQLGVGHYKCMCCDFNRNLLAQTEATKSENSSVSVLAVLFVVGLLAFFVNVLKQEGLKPAVAEPSPAASQVINEFSPFAPISPAAELCRDNAHLLSCAQEPKS